MSEDLEKSPSSQREVSKRKRTSNTKGRRKRQSPVIEREAHQEHSSKEINISEPSLTDDASVQAAGSSFCCVKASFYLPLSPISQLQPLQGICAEHLSPLILTYYPPLKGIVLSYADVKLSEQPDLPPIETPKPTVLAKSIDEFAVSFVWVTANFVVFRPQQGGHIEGRINIQNESHIGLVCWNLFNANIERRKLPREWKWVGTEVRSKKRLKYSTAKNTTASQDQVVGANDQTHNTYDGHFEDEHGRKIEGTLHFRISDIETSASTDKEKAFLTIEGTLLPEGHITSITKSTALAAPDISRSKLSAKAEDVGVEIPVPRAPRSSSKLSEASATPARKHRTKY